MFLSATFDVIVGAVQTLLKLQQKAVLFTVTNIIKLFMTLGVTILLIVQFHHLSMPFLSDKFAGSLVFILLLLPHILKNLEIRLEMTYP